jgi:hypothetical protein
VKFGGNLSAVITDHLCADAKPGHRAPALSAFGAQAAEFRQAIRSLLPMLSDEVVSLPAEGPLFSRWGKEVRHAGIASPFALGMLARSRRTPSGC